jgi:hypothetical protein
MRTKWIQFKSKLQLMILEFFIHFKPHFINKLFLFSLIHFKHWVVFGHIGDLIEDEPGIGVVAAA